MTINAIPDLLDSREAHLPETYVCPLCRSQLVADKDSTGWVLCPMLNDQAICLGCCLDHQAVARSPDLETHPYRDHFDAVARLTGEPVATLRLICLEHQSSIAHRKLDMAHDKESKDKILALLKSIQKATGCIE